MYLDPIDWILIGLYFAFTLFIAIRFSSKAGKSLGDFFLGGRSLPWWLAGISMVATTFAADTPLAVTELVAGNGISGNWLWWNMLIGGMLTTFFFARLWRRADVLTEVEFINIRYDGQPAWYLRGFKAVYLGLVMNVLILGWVNKALMTLLEVFFNIPETQSIWYVAAAMGIVAVYSALAGLKGIAVTDALQFFIAMAGSVVLAVMVVNSDEVGGISGLQDSLGRDSAVFNFFPTVGASGDSGAGILSITGGAFLAFVGFQWWASWYPGAEPGGGGYIAQRMMATKTEKGSIFATLFFQVAHYCLRPWPWILVGLATLVLYSVDTLAAIDPALVGQVNGMIEAGMAKKEILDALQPAVSEANWEQVQQVVGYAFESKLGYVYAMRDFLPPGLKGLLLVAFLAAYMSTISTQLNWGASYLVNDLYKSHIYDGNDGGQMTEAENDSEQKHFVLVSRIVTVLMMIVAIGVTTQITSISGVWEFMFNAGAGLGLVLILRWFWWRINAWSEISATLAPFIAFGFSKYLLPGLVAGTADPESVAAAARMLDDYKIGYFITIGFTTLVWLLVTYLTRPENDEKLQNFYDRVRPGGAWGKYRAAATGQFAELSFGSLLVCWVSAVLMTYSLLFAFGKLLFGDFGEGAIWMGAAALGGGILYYMLSVRKLFD